MTDAELQHWREFLDRNRILLPDGGADDCSDEVVERFAEAVREAEFLSHYAQYSTGLAIIRRARRVHQTYDSAQVYSAVAMIRTEVWEFNQPGTPDWPDGIETAQLVKAAQYRAYFTPPAPSPNLHAGQ